MNLLKTEELAKLAEKVKTGSATNAETIIYLDTVNGLLGEFIEGLRSMPTDEQLTQSK